MNYTDAEIEALLKGLFEGGITPRKLPKKLYFAIADYLKKGLYSGFGATLENVSDVDFELLAELRTNVYMFSAAKTHAQVNEMSQLLSKTTGFRGFEKQAAQVFDTYNKTWLETEYNTAIGQAQNAVKWQEIQANKKFLPMLKYSAVMDKNTSEICRPLDGITAPVGDPIWRKIMPLNHFNCRCLVIQTDEGTTTRNRNKIVKEVEKDMQDIFKMNAGRDGYIFSPEHPYFEVAKKDVAFAKRNFDLPIPKTDK